MVSRDNKNAKRLYRHKRVRSKISGTPARPRLCVYRSNDNIYVQVIDDTVGNTLVAASSTEKEFGKEGANVEAAARLAQTAPDNSVIVTILCDSGTRYFSEPLWSDINDTHQQTLT